jgi:hypothetical protein
MICAAARYRTQNTFEQMGDAEATLLQWAVRIVDCVDSVAQHITATGEGPYLGLKELKLCEQLSFFIHFFQAWKEPDEARLVQRIKHALHALRTARTQVPPGHAAHDALMAQFNVQSTRLTEKLAQLVGVAGMQQHEQEVARIVDITNTLFNLMVETHIVLAINGEADVALLRAQAEALRHEVVVITGPTGLNQVDHDIALRWAIHIAQPGVDVPLAPAPAAGV